MLRFALMTIVVALLLAPQASAQTYPLALAADRTAFSPAANYMSLPGYLRFLLRQIDGRPYNRQVLDEMIKEQLRQQKRPLVGPAP